MAGFRFRLEPVLRIRKLAVDEQRRVVAGAIRHMREAQDRIGRLETELIRAMEDARGNLVAGRVDLPTLAAKQLYRGHLQRRREEAIAARAARESELTKEREKLGEVSKQLKAIEKLREKQWAEHMTENRRLEQAALDEQSLQRFVFSQSGRDDSSELCAARS